MAHPNPLPPSPEMLNAGESDIDRLARQLLDLSANDPFAALYNAARVIRFLETKAVSNGFMRGHNTSTSPSLLQAFAS